MHDGERDHDQVLTFTPGGKTPVFHDTAPKNECREDERDRKLRNGAFDQAARRREDMAKMGPEEKSDGLGARRKSDTAKAHSRRGQDLEDSGDLTEAEARFREALAIDSMRRFKRSRGPVPIGHQHGPTVLRISLQPWRHSHVKRRPARG